MYKILEDQSPYFIKFTFDNIFDIVKKCQYILENVERTGEFQHHKLDLDQAIEIIKMLPFRKSFPINGYRMSLFITPPRHHHHTHIDGDDNTISLNLGIKIHNNLCTTNWYDSKIIYENYTTIQNLPYDDPKTAGPVDNKKHIPLKSAVVGQNEFVLHNSTIFHDWDNSSSDFERIVLTVRPSKKIDPIPFENARFLLFGI